MRKPNVNPMLKTSLELGPQILFFILYLKLRDHTFTYMGVEYSGFTVTALAFVPIFMASIACLWWLTGELSRMQVFTVVVVLFFSTLTVLFNNETFYKMKTTIVYLFMGGGLAIGLMQGKSYLQYLLKDMTPIKDDGWMILTRRVTGCFFALAIANEFTWRMFSTDTWVIVETFIFPAVLFVFFGGQFFLLRKYFIDDED